jgi:hypothetical protein
MSDKEICTTWPTNRSLLKSDFSVNPTCRSRGSQIPDTGSPDSHPEVGPRICLQKWVPEFASWRGSLNLPPGMGPQICLRKWVPGFTSRSESLDLPPEVGPQIFLRKWVPGFTSRSGSPDLPSEIGPRFASRSESPDLPPEVGPRFYFQKIPFVVDMQGVIKLRHTHTHTVRYFSRGTVHVWAFWSATTCSLVNKTPMFRDSKVPPSSGQAEHIDLSFSKSMNEHRLPWVETWHLYT